MKKGGDKSMILRKFGVKVLRERNAYWEAVNVMGETYCKIAFMNLRSGSCRYIKTDPQELEHIGIKQHRDGSLNYEEWKKKVAADLIHPDFRTHFLERFSLATLREYLQSDDESMKMRYLRWDLQQRRYLWVETEFRRRSVQSDEVILYVKDISKEQYLEKSYQQAVQSERKQKEMAVQVRNNILMRMSKNLQVPAREIGGATQQAGAALLKRDDKKVTYFLNQIQGLADYLTEVARDMEDVNMIQQGELKLEEKNFDVQELARDCDDFFRQCSKGKRISYMWVGNLNGVYYGDKQRIEQLLFNLIENAIKFNKPGGGVYVAVSQKGDDFEFIVKDNGPGIEKIEQALQPYSKEGTQPYDGDGTGIGIGLAVAQGIVEAMEGHMEVKSRKDYGTEVRVSFGLKKDCVG